MRPSEGPYFDYEAAPELFLGRAGVGPLEIVWDTSILIDYLDHGADLWDGREPNVADETYLAELEALGLLITLWTFRDIRFRVLERSVTDAKSTLAKARMEARLHAIDEIAAALSLDGWAQHDEARRRSAERYAEAPAPACLGSLPDGADRELILDAIRLGAHVFLTRDARVLRCAEELRPCRIVLASPTTVVDELADCGALLAVTMPETVYWPIPDLQRMSHLIHVLGDR